MGYLRLGLGMGNRMAVPALRWCSPLLPCCGWLAGYDEVDFELASPPGWLDA